jgi:Domain of unknown function (DUF4149)
MKLWPSPTFRPAFKLLNTLPLWLAAAWWGSLTTLGFFVVPMLFIYLPEPSIAGRMAARLFDVQTHVSVVCGAGLLLFSRFNKADVLAESLQAAMVFIVAGMLLALLVEYGVAPRILARENWVLWHRVGGAMYLLQWLCGMCVFWKLVNALHGARQSEDACHPRQP